VGGTQESLPYKLLGKKKGKEKVSNFYLIKERREEKVN